MNSGFALIKKLRKDSKDVIIIDDVLATGGTALAAVKLCEKLKAEVISVNFVLEIAELKGRQKIERKCNSLIIV